MRATIDRAGRIVIPRDLRRLAGLEAGMEFEVRVDDGAVVIEPAPTPVRIERQGRFAVAQPARPVPPLDQRMVAATRQELQVERGAGRGRRKG